MIQAKVVADSRTPMGERLTTLEVVFPRYILAEKNTHRVLSKNSASSRAIPYKKMVQSVMDTPFIPYAWQKNHPGMQGTEYLSKTEEFNLIEFTSIMIDTLEAMEAGSKEYLKYQKDLEEKVELIQNLLSGYTTMTKTLDEWWLLARDKAVECSAVLYVFGVTKQLANRLLEPFMYHKVLVSATEWDNFFNLRCPQYDFIYEENPSKTFKSRKDFMEYYEEVHRVPMCSTPDVDKTLEWLSINKGQADIHMMFLAEAIYDAIKESTPKELKEGEWHIPYGDNMDYEKLVECMDKSGTLIPSHLDYNNLMCKISIARCARLSYQTLGDNPEINYEKDLELYETLSTSGHWSPFEHVAKVMTEIEYFQNIKGYLTCTDRNHIKRVHYGTNEDNPALGWCRNFKGFIQYRELLD